MSRTYKDQRKFARKKFFKNPMEWSIRNKMDKEFPELESYGDYLHSTPKLSNHKRIRRMNRVLETVQDEIRAFKKWNGKKLIKTGYSWRKNR